MRGSSSEPGQRPPSCGRRTVANRAQGLFASRRLKSGALARKSRRSSMSRAPRLAASWISICTILCRVRPITTQICSAANGIREFTRLVARKKHAARQQPLSRPTRLVLFVTVTGERETRKMTLESGCALTLRLVCVSHQPEALARLLPHDDVGTAGACDD